MDLGGVCGAGWGVGWAVATERGWRCAQWVEGAVAKKIGGLEEKEEEPEKD